MDNYTQSKESSLEYVLIIERKIFTTEDRR